MPSSGVMERHLRREVENILDRTYDWRYSGYCIGLAEDQVVKDAQAKVTGANETILQAHTYGEVTPNGVRQLAEFLGLTVASPDAVSFLDLGSGVGKMVLQMYLEVPRVTRSLGVELHPTRAQRGQEALAMLKQLGDVQDLRRQMLQGAVLARRPQAPFAAKLLRSNHLGLIDLLEADMFDLDLSQFTHIYLASLTWGTAMINRLAAKLVAEASRLQVVAALSRFETGLEGFEEEEQHFQTSWTTKSPTGSRLFVYTRAG